MAGKLFNFKHLFAFAFTFFTFVPFSQDTAGLCFGRSVTATVPVPFAPASPAVHVLATRSHTRTHPAAVWHTDTHAQAAVTHTGALAHTRKGRTGPLALAPPRSHARINWSAAWGFELRWRRGNGSFSIRLWSNEERSTEREEFASPRIAEFANSQSAAQERGASNNKNHKIDTSGSSSSRPSNYRPHWWLKIGTPTSTVKHSGGERRVTANPLSQIAATTTRTNRASAAAEAEQRRSAAAQRWKKRVRVRARVRG